MKNTNITILLTVLMSMIGVNAFSYDDKINGIYYNLNGDEAIVTFYASDRYNEYAYTANKYAYTGYIVIPETVNYGGKVYKVTSIGMHAFSNCFRLISVTIPNSVTNIGDYAFSDCTGLTSVRIGNSVTGIGSSAFHGCYGLTSITIPNSVTSIGSSAFHGCYGLTSIKVASGNNNYDSRDNCNAIIETASNTLIVGCKTTIIPNSVKSIGDGAFSGCKGLTSITIPNSVTSIGNFSFSSCSGLTSFTIPSSVLNIGVKAFSYCSGLTSVTFHCKVIGAQFAQLTSIKEVVIGEEVTNINNEAFLGCSGLTSVTIPTSVTTIGKYAFYNCSGLTSINIPNSVTSIGYGAFEDCSSLTSVSIGNSVRSIGERAFLGCSALKNVYNEATTPQKLLDNPCFNYTTATLHVPAGTKELYQAANYWKNFSNILDENEYILDEVMVEVSSSGFATFYNSNSAYLLPDNLYAKVITSESSSGLTYKKLNGEVIPKGVPVIIVSKNGKGGNYILKSTTDITSYSEDNLLRGSNVQTVTSSVNGVSTDGDTGYTYYKLAYGKSNSSNSNTLGWYWGAANGGAFQIQGGKAWLAIPKSSLNSKSSMFIIDETTEVDMVNSNEMIGKEERTYNLSGQKVGDNYRGIIIRNCKKILK